MLNPFALSQTLTIDDIEALLEQDGSVVQGLTRILVLYQICDSDGAAALHFQLESLLQELDTEIRLVDTQTAERRLLIVRLLWSAYLDNPDYRDTVVPWALRWRRFLSPVEQYLMLKRVLPFLSTSTQQMLVQDINAEQIQALQAQDEETARTLDTVIDLFNDDGQHSKHHARSTGDAPTVQMPIAVLKIFAEGFLGVGSTVPMLILDRTTELPFSVVRIQAITIAHEIVYGNPFPR